MYASNKFYPTLVCTARQNNWFRMANLIPDIEGKKSVGVTKRRRRRGGGGGGELPAQNLTDIHDFLSRFSGGRRKEEEEGNKKVF